jgi:hypothetical protein
MRNFIIVFLLISFAYGYAQTFQWSTPMLMCDSMANNINPSFIHGWDYMVDYNFMIWERDFGDSSKILCIDFSQPDSEYVLVSSMLNYKVSNPKISNAGIVVWQDDRNNNNDIFSALIHDNELVHIQQVTNSPLQDINPDILENLLVWERNGAILYSEFNYYDSTCSQEIILDSSDCSNPATNYWQIAYQKQNGDSSEIYLIENLGNPIKISHKGDNIDPTFSFGYFYNLLWQQKIYDNWGIFAVSSYWVQDTITFNFNQYNETNPAAFGIPFITKESNFEYIFLAFETDSTGNQEIFVNNNMWQMLPQNISNYNAEDRIPVFSSGGWLEGGYNMVRVWLVWESWRNNQWQLWGSYNDVIVVGIDEKLSINPAKFQLFPNYPNPFNSQTNIKYYLPKPGGVKIEIYNLLGQKIRTLINQPQKSGMHQVVWNGRDENGISVSSGVYIYNLTSGNYSTSKKLLILK